MMSTKVLRLGAFLIALVAVISAVWYIVPRKSETNSILNINSIGVEPSYLESERKNAEKDERSPSSSLPAVKSSSSSNANEGNVFVGAEEEIWAIRIADQISLEALKANKAKWLAEHGYPTPERKEELMNMSLDDLRELAKKGDIAAKSLLGLRLGIQAKTNAEKNEALYWLDEAAIAGSGLGPTYHAQLREMFEPTGMTRMKQSYYRTQTQQLYLFAHLLGDPNGIESMRNVQYLDDTIFLNERLVHGGAASSFYFVQQERMRRGLPPLVVPPSGWAYSWPPYWGQKPILGGPN